MYVGIHPADAVCVVPCAKIHVCILEHVEYHPLLQAVVWDIRHCALVWRLEGHRGAVFAVDLDSLARIAFTASGDKVEYSQGRV